MTHLEKAHEAGAIILDAFYEELSKSANVITDVKDAATVIYKSRKAARQTAKAEKLLGKAKDNKESAQKILKNTPLGKEMQAETDGTSKKMMAGAAAVGLGGLGFGYYQYQQNQNDQLGRAYPQVG